MPQLPYLNTVSSRERRARSRSPLLAATRKLVASVSAEKRFIFHGLASLWRINGRPSRKANPTPGRALASLTEQGSAGMDRRDRSVGVGRNRISEVLGVVPCGARMVLQWRLFDFWLDIESIGLSSLSPDGFSILNSTVSPREPPHTGRNQNPATVGKAAILHVAQRSGQVHLLGPNSCSAVGCQSASFEIGASDPLAFFREKRCCVYQSVGLGILVGKPGGSGG